jgi:hypothetical protein
MPQRLIPGSGWVDDTSNFQRLIPGVGFVEEQAVAGPQTLLPSLFTNAQTFYAPSVSFGTPQTLSPSLLTNAQTFYGGAVALPGVTAAYVLANTAPVDGNVAGAMYEVAGLVSPGDYMTYTTVSGPTPSGGTLVEYIDGSFEYTGGAPATWVIQIKINGVDYPETTTVFLYDQQFTLIPPLLNNGQTFFAPTVSSAAGAQSLQPSLLVNNQTFFAPTVARGAVAVAPPLVNSAATIFPPRVRNVLPPVPGTGRGGRMAIGIRIGL